MRKGSNQQNCVSIVLSKDGYFEGMVLTALSQKLYYTDELDKLVWSNCDTIRWEKTHMHLTDASEGVC